jgi:(2R)-ethylmalonyl-CoA mutase
MKSQLVESNRARIARIESGDQIVVGVNAYTESEPSPLLHGDDDDGIMVVDPEDEERQREAVASWREDRDEAAAAAALKELDRVARSDENIMQATLTAARAGVTTGEWAATLRGAFGEFRAPTGVGDAVSVMAQDNEIDELRDAVEQVSERLGRRVKILVGKPGLDGHSNGAEQIAVRARDIGMDVVYEGIRLTPEEIATSSLQEGVHVVGLSILSGSHKQLIPAVIGELKSRDVEVPVVVGGIIPEADVPALKAAGVAAVYTPKDFELNRIMRDIVSLVDPDAATGR